MESVSPRPSLSFTFLINDPRISLLASHNNSLTNKEKDPIVGTGVEKKLRIAAASSEEESICDALQEVTNIVLEGLQGQSPDFALLFVSTPHIFRKRNELTELLADFLPKIDTVNVIGCSGSGVIGGDREIEQSAGVSLFAGSFPNAQIQSRYLNELDRRRWKKDGVLKEKLGLIDSCDAPVFILSDPFTFNIEEFLEQFEDEHPNVPILGGLASGPGAPGLNALFHRSELKNNGCVLLQVQGDFDFQAIVSQGCKPIGRPGIVTAGKSNVISSIRSRSPREELQDMILEASEEERELMQSSLLIGRVIDERKHEFLRGDFLIRPIFRLGEEGMVIGDTIKRGQTVQFHVRDAQSAREDLEQLLEVSMDQDTGAACGALLFTCNGRGQNLFGEPNHDTSCLRSALGEVPVGGFFCGGEIGPIGKHHFLHGFTSCVGIFRESGGKSSL
jgi:small ligand-binding sensory domain FIST